MPFRETHHVSGRAVAQAEKLGIPISQLTLGQLRVLSDKFEADASLERVLSLRDEVGSLTLLVQPEEPSTHGRPL